MSIIQENIDTTTPPPLARQNRYERRSYIHKYEALIKTVPPLVALKLCVMERGCKGVKRKTNPGLEREWHKSGIHQKAHSGQFDIFYALHLFSRTSHLTLVAFGRGTEYHQESPLWSSPLYACSWPPLMQSDLHSL
jgi:hypothetical protein